MMKGPADAPLAYAGLLACLAIGLVVLYSWLAQTPGGRQPGKLAARRNRNVLRRMGFSSKEE